MRITAVIVTCNRLELLPRALKSVRKQKRKPNFVWIISNSNTENYEKEKQLCSDFGFTIKKNRRTKNNAGALNSAIEETVKEFGIQKTDYIAFLDDDDEWHSDYLQKLEEENHNSYDVLLAELSRNNGKSENVQVLPKTINTTCFLRGNPGIGNSNTFVKLSFLLKAGGFDESCLSNIDRDLFIRLFQLNPNYKVINKHLVNHYTDNERERITNNISIRKKSFQYFYFKYSHFMSDEIKQEYFEWAKNLFNINQSEIEVKEINEQQFYINEIIFSQKENSFQFVIGFIAGNDKIGMRVVKQIIQIIPTDLILIIDDAPKLENLDGTYQLLNENNIPFKIVRYKEWNSNLASGYYGEYFEKFDDITSIPLGRTILHRHLFDETANFKNPVYWIIDDDIDLSSISTNEGNFNFFNLIYENIGKTDAIIGGISNDPPIPALSCIRTQLIDFLHSYGSSTISDFHNIHKKPDYYYDLSDLHSDHLETPILKSEITESHLHQIFSGKAVFRPALQQDLKSENKTITRRGANTIVLNREVLRLYPVINLEVNDKFARRGDLTWALFNQVVSGKKFIEHTFCINHNRPLSKFNLERELDKSAYDIIGFAFNKAVFKVIDDIKKNEKTDVFKELLSPNNFKELKRIYLFYLQRRKARFTMNYYRIIGLIKIISEKYDLGKEYYEQFKDERKLSLFENIMLNAVSESHLKRFMEELKIIVEENITLVIKK
jgi:hypothetical protein